MKSRTLLFVAATWLLSAFPAWASNRDANRDVGPTDDVAKPCINAYYGIGEVVDYTKAYKCFESLRVYQFMVLMQLNGQGIPASAIKAKEIMDEWRKKNPNYTDEALFANDRMADILKQKTIETPVSPKLDYCNDVASFGYEEHFCADLDNTLSEQNTNQAFAKIRAKLRPEDAAHWDAVVKSFEDYLQTEGDLGEDEYAGGTLAPVGYNNQQIYVRENFLRFAQRSFVDMKLEPVEGSELAASENAMNSAYDEAVAHYENTDDPGDDADSNSDFVETEKRYLEKAKSDLAASQKSWVVLEEECAKLAASIYGNKSKADWSVSAKNALALVRAADIKQATSD